LRSVNIHWSDIALATVEIMQKLRNLSQLKTLKLTFSKLFHCESSDLIYEWLDISLPYFPKSLEIIDFLRCKASNEFHTVDSMNRMSSRIESRFHDALSNLREINIIFIFIDDLE
jgi:hypothetical protein